MTSQWAVVGRLQENTNYQELFHQIYGIELATIPAPDPGATNAPPDVLAAFAAATQAISQFERSPAFSKFSSKFDYFLAGQTTLSSNEWRGYNLFQVKAGCSACHISDPGTDAQGNPTPPLFSNFTYHNLGLPRNSNIPGQPAPDLGLGGRSDIAALTNGAAQLGKHKVMSLRNIALTAPYGHNGVFTSLEQVVHFYNTRDVLGRVDSNTNAAFGVTGWPPPEVAQNINFSQMGNLHLTAAEEADLVAFLKTLTDNYPDSGGDPNVPPGTASPFASFAIPQIPVRLSLISRGTLLLSGRLGQSYQLQFAASLGVSNVWQSISNTRLLSAPLTITDTNAPLPHRFYRAQQLP
jgi:cytochrome c peroxidase